MGLKIILWNYSRVPSPRGSMSWCQKLISPQTVPHWDVFNLSRVSLVWSPIELWIWPRGLQPHCLSTTAAGDRYLTYSGLKTEDISDKQRFLTPGHQGWNDLHSLCRIGMEYYLLNNDDNNIIYWIMMIIMIMMMIIIMKIMMTMMIIGTATIMIMIIIITTTLTMTIMKMIMIKTAQTPCQSLYKDRRI